MVLFIPRCPAVGASWSCSKACFWRGFGRTSCSVMAVYNRWTGHTGLEWWTGPRVHEYVTTLYQRSFKLGALSRSNFNVAHNIIMRIKFWSHCKIISTENYLENDNVNGL